MSRRRNTHRDADAVCAWCQLIPARDDAFVCDGCLDDFATALRELLPGTSARPEVMLGHVGWCEYPRRREIVPGLWEDLEAHVAGERGIDYRTLGGSGGLDVDDTDLLPGERRGVVPTGIVIPQRAAQVKTELVRSLRALVVACRDARIEHTAPDGQELRSNRLVPAMSEWLQWRVDAIAFHPEVAEHARVAFWAIDSARWVIDRPSTRQHLGDCPVEDCDGYLTATPEATFAHCNIERHAVEAQPLRDRLIADLDDKLMPAADIARISTYLGLRRDRVAVRKQINQWAHRDRIWVAEYDTPLDDQGKPIAPLVGPPCDRKTRCHEHGCAAVLASRGEALFRFEQVYDALLEHEAKTNPIDDEFDTTESKGA